MNPFNRRTSTQQRSSWWFTTLTLLTLLTFLLPRDGQAQSVCANPANNNGSGKVTFNFRNNNAYDVVITDISSLSMISAGVATEAWYRPSALAYADLGSFPALTTANWTQFGGATITGVANTTTTVPQTFFNNTLSLVVPAGATYGICINAASAISPTSGALRYSTLTTGTPYVYSTDGCDILLGGAAGAYASAAGVARQSDAGYNAFPRGFIGCVTFGPATPCNGTPTPGNTITSNATPCSGSNFTLSLQYPINGLGGTYQWQRADDAGFTTNLTALGTSSTQVTSHTAPKYYRCIVSCPSAVPTDGTSNGILVNVNTDLCQCASYPAIFASNAADEALANVTVGSMNNSSNCSTVAGGAGSILNRYANYAGIVSGPVHAQGDLVSFSLTQTSCGGAYGNGMQLYADWNQDGDFLDVGEKLYTQPTAASGNHTKTGTFTVPVTATLGTTRMRAVAVEVAFPTATNYAQSAYTYGETEDYCFTVIAASACAGTPTPGNTLTSNANPCSGANFTLSLQNTTLGSGVTYQWERADDAGFSVNMTALGTSSTQLTSHTAPKYYRCIVSCPAGVPAAGTSTGLLVNVNTDLCQCASYPAIFASSAADEELANVTVGSMNNSSNCSTVAGGAGSILNRYANYAGIVAGPVHAQGDVVSFSLTQTSCGGAYGNGMQLYADWNQDGDFLDAGEQLYTQPTAASGNHTKTGTFTVPVTATLGTTRMRAVAVEITFPTATNYAQTAYSWGETEDYCFTVTPGSQCTGTPAPGNTTGPLEVASGGIVNLGLQSNTPGIGVTYQWYVSTTSSTGPWSNGGTGATYAPTQTAKSWYYADVTCSGNTGSSNVLQVDMAYCIPAPTTVDGTGITRVVFSTVNNPTGAEAGNYGNYSALIGNVTQGTTVPVAITYATGLTYATKIWIDWNDDRDFNDAGEEVYSGESLAASTTTLNASFDVGMNPAGNHRMRIGGQDNGPCIPCYVGAWGTYEDYTVNVLSVATCAGTPTPGATTGPSAICISNPVNLGLTNATIGGGVTYQWFASTNSITGPWTPVGTGLATYSPVGQTVQTWYYAEVTCNGNTGSSSVLQVSMNAPTACYCTPGNFTYDIEPITLVNFAGINQSSCAAVDCDGDVVDYTAGTPGAVIAGQSYTITVKGNTNGSYTSYFTAFFDWDQNGTFEDAQNIGTVTGSTGLDAIQASASIAVPLNAVAGSTRMRMIKYYSFDPIYPSDPCGTYDYGQVEDYAVNVTVLCIAPAVTIVVTPNCPSGFGVAVAVADFGSGASALINWSLNGVAQTPFAAVIGTNLLPGGPFANGADVDVTVLHEDDSECNVDYNNNTYACPPANDDCANAIALECNSVTFGTTTSATTETPTPEYCETGATAPGVWYTVQGFDGDMEVTTCGSSNPFDTKLNVYSGSCGSMVCVGGNDDAVPSCGPNGLSRYTWTGSSANSYYILVQGHSAETGDFQLFVGCGNNNNACTENGLAIEFQTNNAPFENTWDVLDATGQYVVVSGGPLAASGALLQEFACVPDGCYQFRVNDSGGNGMGTGGYVLRTQGTNIRIIDNANNFNSGSVSQSGEAFCLPLGTVELLYSSCDKYFWANGEYIVCNEDAAVAADYNGGGAAGADSGYDFWFFDPNGTYSYVRSRRHTASDNFANIGSTRTCHMKVNNWTGNQIPNGLKLNVRVRPVVNGVAGAYGPACRFTRDEAVASCPPTLLFDVPGSPQFYSCGVSRKFVNNTANRLYARPVEGATQYRFTFSNAELGPGNDIVLTSNAYYINLGWTNGPVLLAGQSYDVTVEAFKGGTWCIPGKACIVTINNLVAGGQQNVALDGGSALNMWPNPNNGEVLNMSLQIADPFISTVSMDIFDLSGKRMVARTVAIQDGTLNTTIDLNGDLAVGMYMVKVTAGEEVFTQRVVIQK